MVYLMNQVRRPSRCIERGYLWLMNLSHSAVTDWGLRHVTIEKRFTVLDVGCGGGRTIERLAAIASDGFIYGIDYTSGSVATSSGAKRRVD
jgi:ubiquinone/menaquinone biosynthesis C-methylase UbiE